jgi:hypothetical protein
MGVSAAANPIANGAIEGRIEDAQGRFNLNNLALDTPGRYRGALAPRQSFSAKGIDPRMLDAIADWIDADSAPRANGAEDEFYAQRRANGSGRQRAARPGSGIYVRSRRQRESVGGSRPRRRRAACGDDLSTSIPRMPRSSTPRFRILSATSSQASSRNVARRTLLDLAELRERLPRDVKLPDSATFSFSSSYFLVSVRSRQGDAIAQARAAAQAGRPRVAGRALANSGSDSERRLH